MSEKIATCPNALKTDVTRRYALQVIAYSTVISFSTPTFSQTPRATPKGHFKGRVLAEWMPGGRNMKLEEPFEYIAANGRPWPVPAGTTVDGASIPRFFWSFIGGPFEGPYREASVIHDHFCDTRTRRFQDVHGVFYEAMLTSGVDGSRAWLMYGAVNKFGPRWEDPRVDPRCEKIDKNYDYNLCAQNAEPPAVVRPAITKTELNSFAKGLEGEVSSVDLKKLQDLIGNM